MVKRTLILLLLLLSASSAQQLSAETVLERHQKAGQALEDVQAKVYLELDLTLGILPYSEKLKGRYFFLQPNQHRLEFDDAPTYFEKAPDMFKWELPSLKKYSVSAVTSEDQQHHDIFFRPKNPQSSTQSIVCRFEGEKWRLLNQKTSYRDGGSVKLSFVYKNNSELPVLELVTSQVSIPSYSLSGQAKIRFSDQRTNEGFDSSIFESASK